MFGVYTSLSADLERNIQMTYHSTIVVLWNPFEQWIRLHSGGWQTHTTKKRMNQFAMQFNLDYRVYSKDFEWFVSWNGLNIPFSDGMRIPIERSL